MKEQTSHLASKARAAGVAPPSADEIAGVASRVGMEASSATAVGEVSCSCVASQIVIVSDPELADG